VNSALQVMVISTEVGWIERTPKSDRIERRRCQVEKGSSGKVHKGVQARSGEAGVRGGVVLGGGRLAAVFADIDTGELGEGGEGWKAWRRGQELSAVDRS